MKYLYGNSNESDLDQNYLEFLRLALDFSVSVLQSETKIMGLQRGIVDAEAKAVVERSQLLKLQEDIDELMNKAVNLESMEIAVACRDAVQTQSDESIKKAQWTVESNLTSLVDQSYGIISSERNAHQKRLELVLLTCDLPRSSKRVNVNMPSPDGYRATLAIDAGNLVNFEMDLGIPAQHLFSELVRVEKVFPNLQVSIMESAGWLKKGTKVAPQKLGKEYVYSLNHTADAVYLCLRSNPKEPQSGYDIVYRADSISVTKIQKQQEGDPFVVDSSDAQDLRELYNSLNAAAVKLESNRRQLINVQLEETPLASHTEPTRMIQWLIEQMTPVVNRISENSLSPTELVLKRVLNDGERFELFASKAELYEKLLVLTDDHKRMFEPLGLNVENSGTRQNASKSIPSQVVESVSPVTKPVASEQSYSIDVDDVYRDNDEGSSEIFVADVDDDDLDDDLNVDERTSEINVAKDVPKVSESLQPTSSIPSVKESASLPMASVSSEKSPDTASVPTPRQSVPPVRPTLPPPRPSESPKQISTAPAASANRPSTGAPVLPRPSIMPAGAPPPPSTHLASSMPPPPRPASAKTAPKTNPKESNL